MNRIREYVFPFIFGGILVTLIELLSNKIDPDYAGIIAAFPIAIMSTFFIDRKNLTNYFIGYSRSLIILLFLTVLYYLFLKNTGLSKNRILGLILFLWLAINISYIFLLKK